MLTRRHLLKSFSSGAAMLVASGLLPAWARSPRSLSEAGITALSGNRFDLDIARSVIRIDGRTGEAITVNGTLPAPLLRWKEGEQVTMRVTNHLDEDTSIHWHGMLVPFQMDGVPGVTFPGIKAGETFEYTFPVRQSGTYWYHSHSGLQEQLGHYGPLVVDPAGSDPVGYDREYVVVLSDYTFEGPHRVFAKLKKMSDTYNFQERTAGDFMRDVSRMGLGGTVEERLMWGDMRMSPTDIADVTGATYTFLVNGHGPGDNWTALFEPGERVRLRFVNASAMSIFNVRIPGLPMSIVQADGQNVRPVERDEFQIGVAETYDVVVTPRKDQAYTLMCESIDRSGYGRATLAPRPGMEAEVPPLRPRPLLTMKDMGMAGHGMSHGGMDHAAMDQGEPAGQKSGEMDHGSMDHSAMGHGSMDHGAMSHESAPAGAMQKDGMEGMGAMEAHNHPTGPGVANTAMQPQNRLGEPGVGLEDVAHRVLVYTDLESLAPNPDTRAPGREMELHLTGNMERYMWSFDGKKFSEVTEPIIFHYGERLRLTMVNDTMMPHPIHLHGMFFELVTGAGDHKPRKHTIVVKPGEKMSFDVTADEEGDWAFHCHLLYHMHAGMFQVVSVRKDMAEASQ
ncbi:copper resistance system multicopper oxidase [Tepidicaulis sp. LMO-SS28]|uniref:copper resistance system multicopper oxidase n=1 Tax=Tepidicaulis sp. LMO-SS28 TaxID=3447455 RepID=UPI003EE2BF23